VLEEPTHTKIPYCTVLYSNCTVLYCTVTVLYCTVRLSLGDYSPTVRGCVDGRWAGETPGRAVDSSVWLRDRKKREGGRAWWDKEGGGDGAGGPWEVGGWE